MFKKSVLVLAILFCSVNVWAVTRDVSQTRHNVSSTQDGSGWYPSGNQYMSTNEDEVCIFCHTPHGGALNTPLWNRAVPSGANFTHYTSTTMSPYLYNISQGASKRNVSPESLLCMGCHDGVLSMNAIINYSNQTGGQPTGGTEIKTMFGLPGAVIGDAMNPLLPGTVLGDSNNLSDDHPISFSYYDATADTSNNGEFNLVGGANDPIDKGIRFFGAASGNGSLMVECSTCHDPHINYEPNNGGDAAYAPFLVMSNANSGLCLACHIK